MNERETERRLRDWLDVQALPAVPDDLRRSIAAIPMTVPTTFSERLAATLGLRQLAYVPSVAWILLLTGLLLAAVVGGLVAGGWRLDRMSVAPMTPTALQPTGIEVLNPESTAYDRVVVDRTGTYWAIGAGHVTRFDPVTGERKTWTESDDAAFGGGAAGPASSGGVWIGMGPKEDSLVRRFDGTAFRETIRTPCNDPYCGRIEVAADGTLWYGLDRWNGSAWVSPPAVGEVVMSEALARDGATAWAADVNDPAATWRLADGEWTSHRLPVDDPAYSDGGFLIMAASNGSAWIASYEDQDGRVFRFDGRAWTEMEGTGVQIHQLAAAEDGSLWAGVDDGAPLMRYVDGRWTTYGAAEGVDGELTGGISATPAGVFVGTDAGLLRFAGDRWVPAWPDAQAGPASAQKVAAVSRDEAWVTDLGALWHYQDGVWKRTDASTGLPLVDAKEIAVGPDGIVWVTGEDGVAVLTNGTWRTVRTGGAPGLLTVDADGTAWLPAGDGASGEVLAISRDPGIPIRRISCPNTVGSLAVASDGSVYVAGQSASPSQPGGLSRILGSTCTAVDLIGDGRTRDVLRFAAGTDGRLAAVAFVPAYPEPGAPGAPAEGAPAPSTAARSAEPSGIASPEAPAGATPTIWAPQFRLDPNAGETRTMLFDGTRWTEIDRSDRSDVEVFFDPQGRLWSLRNGGFERFDGTRWISSDPGAPPRGMDLSISPDGTFWLIGWESLVHRIQADR